MINLKDTIKQQINQALIEKYQLANIDFQVEYPPNNKSGDYSCNIAMLLAKKLKKQPTVIGTEIIEVLKHLNTKKPKDLFSKIAVVKPGFINFYLDEKFLMEAVDDILKLKEKFGKLKNKHSQKIQIEFISANPTGPLTLANGRGGFSGDVLANILTLAGNKVEREYFVNDFGNQVNILGHSILKDKEAQYKGDYINQLAKEIKATEVEVIGYKAANVILERYIKPAVKKAGIKFDNYFSERKLHQSGKVDKMLTELIKQNLVYKSEEAVWLKTSKNFSQEYKNDDSQDRVLVKSDGSKTYFLADIAYHWNKFHQRKFDRVINLWGADHHGYISRMKTAVAMIGYPGQLEILLMQLVKLVEDGKEKRMSKRAGVYILLDKLIDEVGLDATRFFFLMHANNKAMDFDLKLAKEKSSKNPVYYVQYAHARICSIIGKTKTLKKNKAHTELVIAEKNLIKELIKWPDLVNEVATNYEVHKIPFYAVALADKFHDFYEQCRVIDNNGVIITRLKLIKVTKQVLENVLTILGVSAPEKM